MEKPLVSFILSYYNLPVKMLCNCIDSILALSLRPFEREIIIVDDGSEKSPMNELMKYGSDIVYMRQGNQGLSAARNAGIRMASGQYLQFVDADDELLAAPYEHCLDLVRFGKPEMVVFDFVRSEKESTQQHVTISEYQDMEAQSGSDYMRHHNIRGTACGYLFSRTILGDLRFTPGIYHEDEEFTPLLLLRAETVCVTNAQAYLYNRNPNSIITDSHIRKRLKRLNDAKEVIVRLNTIADRLPANDKQALQRRTAQLTMDYLYLTIRQTQSRHYLERKIEELRQQGLFPLPDRDYTVKYKWFRRLINSEKGITILMRVIPLLNKER
ncbi:MAG: glycosyltransferase [Prevotella sp.]|nr:glycosyltransferase [Prevotella sp.]